MKAFDRVYALYRDDFMRFAKVKYSSTPTEDIVDAWQDAVISFFEQIEQKRLTHLTCAIRSFLFLLGLRYLKKYHVKQARIDLVEHIDETSSQFIDEISISLDDQQSDEQIVLLQAVNQLPEQSKKMLQLRYVEGKSIPEIMQLMEYQSVNAVSVTLSRSLAKIKDLVNQKKPTS